MLHQNDKASTLKYIANHARAYIQENCGVAHISIYQREQICHLWESQKKAESWKDKQQL